MHVQQLAACSAHLLGEHRPFAELDPVAAVAVYLRILQVSRPSKYHADWGVLLGPTTPDPTINTSMLSISSGDGTPLANGGEVRKPSNPNRLYISGLPYNWRTQHVSGMLVHGLNIFSTSHRYGSSHHLSPPFTNDGKPSL
jgi:hypothetical protein